MKEAEDLDSSDRERLTVIQNTLIDLLEYAGRKLDYSFLNNDKRKKAKV